MQLSDKAVRTLKAKEKAYKVTDGQGLYVLVTAQGSRLWRFDHRFQGKRQTLSLGKFPDVGLADARQRLAEARQLLARGRDPGSLKLRQSAAANDNFRALADEWLSKRKKEGLAPQTITTFEWFIRLVDDDLGRLAVRDIGTTEVLRALRRVEARERFHTARRLRSTLSRIFKYGIAAGRAERDPAADLSEALTAAPVKARPAITTAEGLAGILRAIVDYQGAKEVRIGLLLLIHLFCRPGELRHMEWAELDLEKRLWSIPASKMKMRQPHLVPLSTRSLGLLEELRSACGAGRFCFPNVRSLSRPMSENTLNAALRRLGYTRDEVCSHGFRSTASTLLNESWLFNPDAIEGQLAHRPRGGAVRAAYLRGEFLEERVRMMAWWSDYLDQLAAYRLPL